MNNSNNKGQAYNKITDGYSNKQPTSRAVIFLTVAVVLSLALLGLYIWQNREPADNGNNITPTPSESALVTATPDPEQSMPSVTPTPVETAAPDADQEANVTPVPTEQPGSKAQITPIPRLEKFEPVKALYLKAGSFQNPERLEHYIDLANRTEINAYVIDIKGDYGHVYYKSDIPDVVAANASYCPSGFDIGKVIQKLHDNNIRVIGRLVVFKDSVITKYKPEMAIHHNGKVFVQDKDTLWLDATNRDSWDYIGAIVKEAVNYGFDEIQFDYIRFPETSLYEYELQNLEEGKERRDYIEGFIEYIRGLVPEDFILSADVFGMPLISTRDSAQIGQTLESIGWHLDYISPMIYPSHFANNAPRGIMSNGVGQIINGIKFTHPDLKPYEVVYNTLMVGKKRLEAVEGYNLKCRPYIQGFTAGYLPDGYWIEYGVEEYRAQIQAVYDAGFEEWIFWNAPNEYVEEAFLPEGG